MNYLAHLYLAANDDALMLGGLLGDFVKGRTERLPFPATIRQGIRLHRLIDSFTDSHPLVARSRSRMSASRRRYAGIIVDLAYDHFLATHWARFSPLPLADFTSNAYGRLLAQPVELPPQLRQMLPRMAAQDWLASYADLENVALALERIGMRFSRGNPLLGVEEELIAAYSGLEMDFLEFFPELSAYVEEQKILLGSTQARA